MTERFSGIQGGLEHVESKILQKATFSRKSYCQGLEGTNKPHWTCPAPWSLLQLASGTGSHFSLQGCRSLCQCWSPAPHSIALPGHGPHQAGPTSQLNLSPSPRSSPVPGNRTGAREEGQALRASSAPAAAARWRPSAAEGQARRSAAAVASGRARRR